MKFGCRYHPIRFHITEAKLITNDAVVVDFYTVHIEVSNMQKACGLREGIYNMFCCNYYC